MSIRIASVLALAVVTLGGRDLSAQTVALSLSSPQNGDTVTAGAVVQWSIGVSASVQDNAGLALVVVDLVQGAANPATIDIPPAGSVPVGMAAFSRPAGISNPGEANLVTGFVGLQRGTPGQMNLRQIGGAQNTFGVARPVGSGIAESATVVSGVGQGGSVTLASGSFIAPSTPGTYVFQLANPVASVLTVVNAPPLHSPVTAADVSVPSGVITFHVGTAACSPCDANCDGVRNGRDIQAFVARLLSPGSTACSPCSGDLNGSGGVTIADISAFIACQLGS